MSVTICVHEDLFFAGVRRKKGWTMSCHVVLSCLSFFFLLFWFASMDGAKRVMGSCTLNDWEAAFLFFCFGMTGENGILGFWVNVLFLRGSERGCSFCSLLICLGIPSRQQKRKRGLWIFVIFLDPL